jgi:branched-chain amino acid transport system substrate-binding protein
MPLITPTANSSTIAYDKFLRMCLVSTVQAPQIGAMVVNNLKAKKVAILYANDDFGISMRDQTIPVVESFGSVITSSDPFTPGTDKDFSVLLSKVLKDKPDTVIGLGTYNEGSLIVSQAAQMGGFENINFASDASWIDDLFLQRVGSTSLASKVFLATGYNPYDPRPALQAFITKFTKDYSGVPMEPTIYAYDAIKVIAETIAAGATKDNLIETAKTMTFKDLACDADVKFTAKGNRTQTGMDILTIKDGKFAPTGERVDVTGLTLDY